MTQELWSVGGTLPRRWLWFLVLGVSLIACGAAAIALPALSALAASVVLGTALIVSGLLELFGALQVKGWSGRVWQGLIGGVQIVTGLVIGLNPLKGAIALALLIGLLFLLQGGLQVALALRVRPQPGWAFLLLSGLIAFAVAAAVVLKLRFSSADGTGALVGVALLVAGGAYVAIALSNRRARGALGG